MTVPFEYRPRPDADVADLTMTLMPALNGGVVLLQAKDYDAAGRVYAWLLGQMTAAKKEQMHG